MNTTYDIDATKLAMLTCQATLKETYSWYAALAAKFPHLHPIVIKAINLAPPDDGDRLTLERPHTSEKDPSRLAYTRSVDHGERDVQTVTSLGKYLRANFTTLADHQIRDLVALNTPPDVAFKLVHTIDAMITYLESGPVSCMQQGDNIDDDNYDLHPYQTYSPKFGWHLAVRMEGTTVAGRALCCAEGNHKQFVRTYARSENPQNSQADHALEAWLTEQGYTHACSWAGFKLAKIQNNRDYLAPFLDGDCKGVDVHSDCLMITNDGEYICENTDGTMEENNKAHCDYCEDSADEDDMTWIRYEERVVCGHCLENHYVHAYGQRGGEYYIQERDAVCSTDGNWYHVDYLSDNDMVTTYDDKVLPLNDVTFIESEDAYYPSDDSSIIQRADDEYDITDNCWLCEVSRQWYSDDEADNARDLPDGTTAHKDNVDEDELTPTDTLEGTLAIMLTSNTTEQGATL